jgi:DNA-binding NarL/FixJ family response regulator
VAAGRSNTQIAEALVLSDKTVARHLSNIFTKIDATSRTVAAAHAFEHGLA